ncbi:MAG: 4Fe-4S dicluster domain-containing protein [Candidatus Syntrophopropionicum ammoniitolerans]
MESINVNESIVKNADFTEEIGIESGQPVQKCYQCGKCTAGCPLTFAMDYKPNQVIRMVQLGMKDELLKCQTIWICSNCSTCTTRCPCNVEVAEVMGALRIMAGKSGTTPRERPNMWRLCTTPCWAQLKDLGELMKSGWLCKTT